MGVGDLHVWWRSITRQTVEIDGKDRWKGGDKPSIESNWTVEINMEGRDIW